MGGIDKSRTKIKEIEKLLAEVKDRLKTLSKESRSQQKRVITEADLFSKEELEKGMRRKYLPGRCCLPKKNFKQNMKNCMKNLLLKTSNL